MNQTQRVHGHVMAREPNGYLKVRVKQLGHPLDGKKLLVREVRGNLLLEKGDDVHFLVQPGASAEHSPYAIDVVLVREGGQGLSALVGTDELLGIAAIRSEDGDVYYQLVGVETRADLEKWLADAGSTEKVVFYLRLTADEVSRFESDASDLEQILDGFRALVAMLRMEPVRDAFQAILTRFAQACRVPSV